MRLGSGIRVGVKDKGLNKGWG
jgi:hypothetical protein